MRRLARENKPQNEQSSQTELANRDHSFLLGVANRVPFKRRAIRSLRVQIENIKCYATSFSALDTGLNRK